MVPRQICTQFLIQNLCTYVYICAIYTYNYMCSEQLPDRIFQKYCMKNRMVLVELMNACLFANRFVFATVGRTDCGESTGVKIRQKTEPPAEKRV